MINGTLLASDAPTANDRESALQDYDRELDALTRSLASDFPLHSMTELRRTIADAEDDLWPHQDSGCILARARERLREGVIG